MWSDVRVERPLRGAAANVRRVQLREEAGLVSESTVEAIHDRVGNDTCR